MPGSTKPPQARDGQQKVIASITGSAGFPRSVMHVVDTRSAGRDSEPDPIMVTAPLAGQRQGRVVQEEEPLKLSPRRHAREPAVRRLLIAKKLNRRNP